MPGQMKHIFNHKPNLPQRCNQTQLQRTILNGLYICDKGAHHKSNQPQVPNTTSHNCPARLPQIQSSTEHTIIVLQPMRCSATEISVYQGTYRKGRSNSKKHTATATAKCCWHLDDK